MLGETLEAAVEMTGPRKCTYDSEDAVDCVLDEKYHDLGGKQVEVKRILPKDGSDDGCSRSGGGEGYQSYGSSAIKVLMKVVIAALIHLSVSSKANLSYENPG
ncbi:hypothetical protein POM88_011554 [Heracleum sosnowskyi]|uniref:Uncharacterized protein n=1 Tax=Heracleum sosnowskyi TaxID=360622 RepID=A0AAD8IWF7_9APIA|nr:hypothetical protein POM88_011554 [Heracleum sosnowskyi]